MTPRWRIARLGLIAALFAATPSRSLIAQLARGTVTDSASRQPIPGVVVTLLDAGGAVLSQVITSELGEFRVESKRGAKSIRAVRIGFQPRELSFANATADPLVITMIPFAATLATVQVKDCARGNDKTVASGYWDQARAGLLNSVVARKASPMAVHRLYFSKALDESGSVKRFFVSQDYTPFAQTSFTSERSASELVRRGFAGDTGVVAHMFGLDADVLISDAFTRGYCFRVAESDKSRPREIGVGFSAADTRPGKVDVEGVIWIDTAARALRDIEFRYVGMPQKAEQYHPGGTMSFGTNANGIVFIGRWSLRAIGVVPIPILSRYCLTFCVTRDSLYPMENGAEVSHADWRNGLRWDAHLGSVTIDARAKGRPASGAVLQLADSPYQGTTDASGTARITDLLPGRYAVTVREPRLSGLGISLPTSATFTTARDFTAQMSFDIPSVEEFAVGLCRKNGQATATDPTLLIGRVVTEDKEPVVDARVAFAVRQGTGEWKWDSATLKTDANGVFASCEATLPLGSTLQINVESEHSRSRSITTEVKTKTSIVPIRVDWKP